jgi:hypothetical protein
MSHMLHKDDLVPTVVEDLHYISDEWAEDISDGALRRGSTVLRRLLVQGELQRAWLAVGFEREPSITSNVLMPGLPPEIIDVASAGGATQNGLEVGAVFASKTGCVVPADVMKRIDDTVKGQGGVVERLKLTEFTASPCLMLEGATISRRLVIKYISNKIGGAHFDAKRKNDSDGALFRILDRSRELTQIHGKPLVYFELLATGQALVASDDIRKLMAVKAAS